MLRHIRFKCGIVRFSESRLRQLLVRFQNRLPAMLQRLIKQKTGSFFVVSAKQETGVTAKTDYRLATHVSL